MNIKLKKIIEKSNLIKDENEIYFSKSPVNLENQKTEMALRSKVAKECGEELISIISLSHSIVVMDYEVDKFIKNLKYNSVILDVGGCWGWHWRNLILKRPDICVIIVDLLKENLLLAKKLLKNCISENIILVHANACNLPFQNETFDGVWSVQVTQHIESWHDVYYEIKRIMKIGAIFKDYNLRVNHSIKILYKLLGKRYFEVGNVENFYYLRKFRSGFENDIEKIFKTPVVINYSECLFHPDLKVIKPGSHGNILGKLDIFISKLKILNWILARQISVTVKKL